MQRKYEKNLRETDVQAKTVYTLEVFLINGPMTEKFIKQNPIVSRTIEIRGDQTLEELHRTIFNTFDREDEHMYEFQIGGKGPQDPKAKRYVVPTAFDNSFGGSKEESYTTQTSIDSLGLNIDEPFGYWFDFGDNWWHQINVISINEEPPAGHCPKVIKRTGESPPQYVDLDNDD